MATDRRYPLLQRGAAVDSAGTLNVSGTVTTTTTAPGAGGAGALPATPAGYMSVTINGVVRKIPYY